MAYRAMCLMYLYTELRRGGSEPCVSAGWREGETIGKGKRAAIARGLGYVEGQFRLGLIRQTG